jgi:hypothetical protein
MYPASDWSGSLLRATMDISARSIFLPDRPRRAIWVTSVRSRREDVLHLFVHSRRPRRGGGVSWQLHQYLLAVPFAFFPRSTDGLSLVPTCKSARARRAGPVKAGRGTALDTDTAVSRPCLDGTEHGASIKQVGATHRLSLSSRSRGPWRARPRRCARACWRVQSPARCGAGVSLRPQSMTSGHAAPSFAV